MALSLIATPPPAATTHDARLPALTAHHASSNTAVMGAAPVLPLASCGQPVITQPIDGNDRDNVERYAHDPLKGCARGADTEEKSAVSGEYGLPGRAGDLMETSTSFPDQGGLERGERPGMHPHPDDPLGRDAVTSSPSLARARKVSKVT